MRFYNAFLIAFSTYSNIPMPQAKWNDENMKYSICFFPFVGVIIGGLLVGWYFFSALLGINRIVFASVCAILPTLVTGGIHMDGFCDTIDALSSCQPTDRKLEILKDPNAGAFSVIKCCMFYLLYFALFTQIEFIGICVVAVGYVLSRTLSGFSVVNFKCAKDNGILATFKNAAQKRSVSLTLIVICLLSATTMVFINPILGSVAIIFALLTFIYYRIMAYKQFGGITGDIAGYFLSICELFIIIGIFLSERILSTWNL